MSLKASTKHWFSRVLGTRNVWNWFFNAPRDVLSSCCLDRNREAVCFLQCGDEMDKEKFL